MVNQKMHKVSFRSFFQPISPVKVILWAAALIVPAVFFYFILTRPTFTDVYMDLLTHNGVWLFLYTLLTILSFLIKGKKGIYTNFLLQIGAYLCLLAGTWSTAYTYRWLTLGTFTTNDGLDYANDSIGLLYGNLFDYSGKRPFFTGFLSFLFAITGQNQKITLLILTILVATAIFFLVQYLLPHLRPAATGFLAMMFLLYVRRYIGITYTETTGLALSAVGICFYLVSIKNDQQKYSLLGLFFIFLALLIRPSTVLLIPFLLLWGCIQLKDRIRLNMGYFMRGMIILVALLLCHQVMYKVLTDSSSIPFGNYAHTFYGLAQGGVGWERIYTDYPEVLSMPDEEVSPFIMDKALAVIKGDPWKLARGFFKGYSDFFSTNVYSIYDFTGFAWICYLLTAIGLYFLIRNYRKPFQSIQLFAMTGILLSIPFAPPSDAGLMRAYAIAIPFTILLPAYGLSEVLNVIRIRISGKVSLFTRLSMNSLSIHPSILAAGSALLAVSILIAPFGVRMTGKPVEVKTNPCGTQEFHAVTQINRGWYVNVRGDETETFLPEIGYTDFVDSIKTHRTSELAMYWQKLVQPGTSVAEIYNILDDQTYFLFTPTGKLPEEGSLYHVCGRLDESDYNHLRLVHVSDFYPLK